MSGGNSPFKSPQKILHSHNTAVVNDNSDRKSLDILVKALGNLSKSDSVKLQNDKPMRKWKHSLQQENKYSDKFNCRPKRSCVSRIEKAKKKINKTKDGNNSRKNSLDCWLKKKDSTDLNTDKNFSDNEVKKKCNSKKKVDTDLSNKGNHSTDKNSTGDNVKRERSSKKKNDTNSNNETKEESSSKKDDIVKERSESFEKYGIHVPTFESIIASREKIKSHEEHLNALNLMKLTVHAVKFNIRKPEQHTNILDCKHLTHKELKKAYSSNKTYVEHIVNGIQHSDRHIRFQKGNCKDLFSTEGLKYNTSMVVFTVEQKQQLMSYLHEQFKTQKQSSKANQYFFKVLLPELCTKIFMDTHNMSYQEASDYLDKYSFE